MGGGAVRHTGRYFTLLKQAKALQVRTLEKNAGEWLIDSLNIKDLGVGVLQKYSRVGLALRGQNEEQLGTE